MKFIEVQGIAVNKKFYKRFMNALKNFQVTETRKNNYLVIEYSDGTNHGTLSLVNQR